MGALQCSTGAAVLPPALLPLFTVLPSALIDSKIAYFTDTSMFRPFTPLRDPETSGSWDANNAAVHIFTNGTVLVVAIHVFV